MKIDRRFKMIRRTRLLALGQKVARNSRKIDFLTYPPELMTSLDGCIARMDALFSLPIIQQSREVQRKIREEEAQMKQILNQFADFCDALDLGKYDITRLGFAATSDRPSKKMTDDEAAGQ